MGSGAIVRRRIDALAVALGVAMFSVSAFVARDGSVGQAEAGVFEAINRLPGSLAYPSQAVQYLGTLAVGPALVVVALLLRRWRLAAAFALVTAGKLAAERTVWNVFEIHRERPAQTEVDPIVRLGAPTEGLSFVSGHVMLVTGLAWVATPYLRGRWRAAPWALVALVAFARVYLGAHNPLDVVGGLGVGLVLGGAVNLALGVPADESAAFGRRARTSS